MLAPKTNAKPTGDWSKQVSDPTIHFINWDGAKWVAKLNGTNFELAPETEAKPTGDWSKQVSDPTIHFVNWGDVKWVAKLNGTNFELAPKTNAKPTGDWSKQVSDPTIHFVNWDGAKWVAKLSGNGLAPGSLTANPSGLNFGNVQSGTKPTLPSVLTNTGASTVTISQATVTGTGFSLNGLTTPLILAPGKRFTFDVVFFPLSAGNASGSISVTSNASTGTLIIPLTGTGVAAGQVAISPSTVNFGNVTAGSHASQAVKLAATGSNVVVSSAAMSSPEFIVSGLSFPVSILAGKNVQFAVTFTPKASGRASATASFAVDRSNSPVKMSLSGTGQAQAAAEFNVVNNGAVADATEGYNCAIAAGSATLVCSDISFADSDATRAIAIYGAVANVSTTSTSSVFPGSVTVKPGSMAHITPGMTLFCANANGSNGEQLVVTAVSGSTFTATFAKSKSGTWQISSNYVALYTTIKSVTNVSTVVLATPVSQTVSSAMVQIAGAIDNLEAVQKTINQACSAASAANPSTVLFPAGIYGMIGTLFIPDGCSYINWAAEGTVVLLDTDIVSHDPTNAYYGQGASMLAFGDVRALGRAIASYKTSISAGSTLLQCPACSFTTADVGKPLYLEYGGDSYLPLWTTIRGVSGSPVSGIYPAVTLAQTAQTSLPLPVPGLGGPLVVLGYQVMRNIDIGGMAFHNMGYWFHPGFTRVGYPLIQLGSVSQAVKQGLTFHDSTLISATNGCIANNGPNDQYTMENINCLGMSDTAFYLAGANSNVTIDNVVVDNTQYPVPSTALWQAFLIKSVSKVLINKATVRCNCFNGLIEIGDYANFNTTIENAVLNGEGRTPVAIGSNLTSGLTVLDAQIQNIAGSVFRFDNLYVGGINGVTITGTKASNATGDAIWLKDGTDTGHGPSNIDFENNEMEVSGIAINAQQVEGVNHWSGNQLINFPESMAGAWQIWEGSSKATNYVQSNILTGYQARQTYCDSSCKF